MGDSQQQFRRLAILTTVHRWGDPRVFERNASAALEWGLEVHAFMPFSGKLELPPWAQTDHFHLHPLPLPTGRFRRMRLSLFAYRYVLEQGEFDVVHFHASELIPAMIWLRLLRPKTKILYDVHEELPLEILSKPYIPKPFKPIAIFFSRLLWWLAARCFHAFAPATEPIALYWPKQRTRVVHNYPKQTFDIKVPDESPNPNRIVFVGGLAGIRGIAELLVAVKRLRSEFLFLRVELYGRIMDQDLTATIASAVDEGWCLHTVWLSQSELAQKLIGAGIGVAPYHPVPSFIEALPTKLFEYMALGIPALVSDFPLWRKIVEDAEAGIAVAPTRAGLEEGLRFMISNSAKLEEWSRNGRRVYTQKYRWEMESANLLALYEKLGLDVPSQSSLKLPIPSPEMQVS